MIAPWPLTGRSAQLEELGRHYRDPGRAGVVLHGPAGVGKTRLAEEALRLAERGGRRVERAVGHPGDAGDPARRARSPPARRLDDRGSASATTSAPGCSTPPRAAAAAPGRRRPPRAARRRPRPPRRHVGRRAGPADRGEDGVPRRHGPHRPEPRRASSRSSTAMGTSCAWRSGRSTRDELGALLHRALDGPVSDAARAELARLSGGNLQVLTELVRGARERGVLAEIGGAWQLARAAAHHGRARRAGGRAPRRGGAVRPRRARAAGRLRALRPRRPRAGLRLGHDGDARGERSHRRGHLGAPDRRAPGPPALRRGAPGRAAAAPAPPHPEPAGRHGRGPRRSPPRGRRAGRALARRLRREGPRRAAAAGGPARARRPRPGPRHPPPQRRGRRRPVGARPGRGARRGALDERRARGGRARRGLGLGRRSRATPAVPTWPSASPTPASSALAISPVPWPRTRPPASGSPTPTPSPAVDARRASLLAGAGQAGRGPAHHAGDGPGHLPADARGVGRGRGGQPAERRALRRGESDRPSGSGRPRRPARLVGPARDRPAPGQRGSRPRLRRALPRGSRAARTGGRAGAGHQRAGGVGLVRDGPGGGRPGHRPGPGGDPAVRRRGGDGPQGGSARRAGVGPRRRRAGPPAARAVRRGRGGARAGRPGTGTARWPPRWRHASGPGPGSTRAAAISCRRASRIREIVAPVQHDEMYIFELHAAARSGPPRRPGRGRRPARRSSPAASTDHWSRSTPPTPARSSSATSSRQREVVDRYEAIDALGLAAEAAAELADLHRARAEARLATAAMQTIGRPRRAGGRPAHPGAGTRGRRRAAHGPRAGGRAARRTTVAAAETSATISGCRRGPSTPTSPGCTASSGSAVGRSWPSPSTPDARAYVVAPRRTSYERT